jgi:drug/metabolite transporter (DMT)-like permease
MAGWALVVLSSFCSVMIAHLLKVTEYKKLSTVKVLTVNYVVASLVAFFSPVGSAEFVFNLQDATPALVLAIFVGFIFIANFFIYSKSVSKNGVGISVAAMRMSLLIPVLLSTFWYMELMTSMQWIGFATVIVALFLLLPNKRRMLREPKSAAWLLVLLFLGTGLGDGSLKIFEVDFSSYLTKEQFMGTVFLSATVIGFIAVSIQKDFKFTLREIGMGILVGIPNLYSAIFLIQALEVMNGAVVYSVVNTLTVLGATVLGMIRWGDLVTPAQWAGIIATILSILLLM